MMLRLALRSLTTRPLRSAVLAAGFGLGIGVMVELLGVGEVILEQAHSPALQGGGDVIIRGEFGPLTGARFMLEEVLGSTRLRGRIRAASPSRAGTVYVIGHGDPIAVAVRGGIPSLERAIGDPEISAQAGWQDQPADAAWIDPPRDEILRALDRFHPIPSAPSASDVASGFNRTSWAEWLYFNGRSRDGSLRFYLSFIAGDADAAGERTIGVRLQLDRNGRSKNYSATGQVNGRDLLARAPELDVGGNHVRVEGSRYRITLALSDAAQASRPAVTGEIVLDATAGRSLPPAEIHGASDWVSGYVVPVLAGTFHGALSVNGEAISVDNVPGYHDHNWGYWDGVHWQWGQVSNGELSIVYGRVFPPATVADAARVPGFLGVLGSDGPIAFSTNVSIDEDDDGGAPRAIAVRAQSRDLELSLRFSVSESVGSGFSRAAGDTPATFLQLGGTYHVTGHARDRAIDFTARGSAETFRFSREP
jgi:hypothetical protein